MAMLICSDDRDDGGVSGGHVSETFAAYYEWIVGTTSVRRPLRTRPTPHVLNILKVE